MCGGLFSVNGEGVTWLRAVHVTVTVFPSNTEAGDMDRTGHGAGEEVTQYWKNKTSNSFTVSKKFKHVFLVGGKATGELQGGKVGKGGAGPFVGLDTKMEFQISHLNNRK